MSEPVDEEKAKLRALVVEAANAAEYYADGHCVCVECSNWPARGVVPCLVKLAEKLKEAVR